MPAMPAASIVPARAMPLRRFINNMSASRGGMSTRRCVNESVLGNSVRKRPEPQLLFRGRPQPRQAVRLDDQEEDDQRAEDHQFEMRRGGGRQRYAEPVRNLRQHKRQQHEERRAEEAAEDGAEAADDDHEQELERALDRERRRLP